MDRDSKAFKKMAAEFAAHPVALAILPLMLKAQDEREREERDDIAKLKAELEANDMDANKVAPYPKHGAYDSAHYLAKGKYDFCHRVAKTDYDRKWVKGSCFVKLDEEMIARYIERARDEAGFEFELFVYKLCAKVGSVQTAELDTEYDTSHGYALWIRSKLTVTKAEGAEVWNTKRILNRSKYGRPFYQYPTRKAA
jgi:hypothetical protein